MPLPSNDTCYAATETYSVHSKDFSEVRRLGWQVHPARERPRPVLISLDPRSTGWDGGGIYIATCSIDVLVDFEHYRAEGDRMLVSVLI